MTQPTATAARKILSQNASVLSVGYGHSITIEAPASNHAGIIATMRSEFPCARYSLRTPIIWKG